jgi:hypothetical protein
MTESRNTRETPPEETVRRFLDALGSGRVLDAIDAFAMDAVIRDARGKEHRGIRAIVEFVNHLRPGPLRAEEIVNEQDTVTATVRSRAGGREERARHTYTIGGGRVRSLRIETGGRPHPPGASPR